MDFTKLRGFDWNKGNIDKNKEKHGVDSRECEEVFTNQPLAIFEDKKHSQKENRWGALGKTNKGRQLTIYFTVRGEKIRVISTREQGKKDKLAYQAITQLSKKATQERGENAK